MSVCVCVCVYVCVCMCLYKLVMKYICCHRMDNLFGFVPLCTVWQNSWQRNCC